MVSLCTQGTGPSTQQPESERPSNQDNPEVMIFAGAQIQEEVPTLSVGKTW